MNTGIIGRLNFIDNCAGKVVVNAGDPKKFTLSPPNSLINHHSNTMISFNELNCISNSINSFLI